MSSISLDNNPITLTRFLLKERMHYKEASGNFVLLLQSIQLAAKVISNGTRKAGIANLYGVSGDTNSTGDVQKKLDVFANDVMINCLGFSEQAYILCSEENDEPIIIESAKGGYTIVFDPLDGSSNIDCNLSVGTIFGIYKKSTTGSDNPLRPGNELLASGYALYDAATMLVLTTGHGVNAFTLDPSLGEFILTNPDLKIPQKGKVYSINEGNSNNWDLPTQTYVEVLKKKGYSGRYVGSMVGDVHRTLLYGGVFCYPADQKNPKGKLRLLYECNPMSYLVEQAGGKSTTGTKRVLDLVPTKLHDKCPIFIGSPTEVDIIMNLYKQHNGKAKL